MRHNETIAACTAKIIFVMTFNNRKEFKWIISALKPERHSYQNEFKRRYWKSSFMKVRVQCSFHHPYRGKQTTVFAAGNTNYWSISDTTVLVTVCGLFDMMRAIWIVIILLASVLQGKLYSMPQDTSASPHWYCGSKSFTQYTCKTSKCAESEA